KLSFTDLGTGTKESTYDATTGEANLVIGGQTFMVYVNQTDGSLAVDLNGDGVFDSSDVKIVDKYGAEVSVTQTDANTINTKIHTDAAKLDSGLEENINLEFERDIANIDLNPDAPSRYEDSVGNKIGKTRYGARATECSNGNLFIYYPEMQEEPYILLTEQGN
ncbi:hypothetical protein KY315_03725, partial [Candidatus Woesearchaeota archaeon]|nr:hypothetical protein [Candidatus Woesearchaeota archaeon]